LDTSGGFSFPSILDTLIKSSVASDQDPLNHLCGDIIRKQGDLFHNLIERDGRDGKVES